MLLACIWEVPILNVSEDMDCLGIFAGLYSISPGNSRIILQIRWLLLPSTLISNSLISLSFDTVWSKLPTVPLNAYKECNEMLYCYLTDTLNLKDGSYTFKFWESEDHSHHVHSFRQRRSCSRFSTMQCHTEENRCHLLFYYEIHDCEEESD
jgi:hypothetical protein